MNAPVRPSQHTPAPSCSGTDHELRIATVRRGVSLSGSHSKAARPMSKTGGFASSPDDGQAGDRRRAVEPEWAPGLTTEAYARA
jgi:hypothetical protein